MRDEHFEYIDLPDTYGDRMPDIDAFLDWCVSTGNVRFDSIKQLRFAHDEFAWLFGHQYLTARKLSRLIAHTDRIKSWRDRKAKNATRYKIKRSLAAVKAA